MTVKPVSAVMPAALPKGPLVMPGILGEDLDLRYELSPDLVTLSDARPAEAEAIRTVRTHIMARHLEDGRRGVATCAATPDVGCSFVAANLAVALSQAGIATLLIDGDMRHPQLEKFIKPSQPSAGLKQCLESGGRPPSDFIHQEVLPNLSVLYAGGVAHDAQELLAGDGFKRLIERSLRDFEFTIIDTPPANGVADVLRISSKIGYAIVVARAHVTRSNDIAALAKQLQEDGAEVVGTILNEI